MKITFLGTGTSQGVPVIACKCPVCLSNDPKDKRLRTSLLITGVNTTVVMDTGPDFRQQMLRENVQNLDAVVFTHEHRDHIAGLDDIRAYNFVHQRPMEVFTEERVLTALKYEYPYIFAEKKYPGIPKINVHLIDQEEFSVGDLRFIPIRVMHYHLPVLGFRIGDFAYITDANFISEQEKEKLYGVKYFIINALRREKHVSHFSLDEAVSLIREISPRRAFLTHLSHQIGCYKDLQKELPAHITVAYDGLSFEVA
ncbi:MAG: MBL fold metallo-hydrolase [Bacteroidales bacterium]|nr:MBL fold metallo-hydrolase [Bacteroidales bacterium]